MLEECGLISIIDPTLKYTATYIIELANWIRGVQAIEWLSKAIAVEHNKVQESNMDIEMDYCWIGMVSSQLDDKSGGKLGEWSTHVVSNCRLFSSACLLLMLYTDLKCLCRISFYCDDARRKEQRSVKWGWKWRIMRCILFVTAKEKVSPGDQIWTTVMSRLYIGFSATFGSYKKLLTTFS